VRVPDRVGRFGITSPRSGDSIPGWVSGPLSLPLVGLGVMGIIIASEA